MTATASLKIDFVSDLTCPWCAVGLNALEEAIRRVSDAVAVELRFQPFEINPDMPMEGQEVDTYLRNKYGLSDAQMAQNRAVLRERGAAVGFQFNTRERIVNTFDVHRLLHWAGLAGAEYPRALTHALQRAYFTDGENISDHAVLQRLSAEIGLEAERAGQVLVTGEYAEAVRAEQKHYGALGINAVPSVIINDRHMLQGGQPPEVFERALRQVAAGMVADRSE